jgi:hypothetical protein
MSPTKPRPAGLDDLSELNISDLGFHVAFHSLERTGVWETFAAKDPGVKQALDDFLANEEERW